MTLVVHVQGSAKRWSLGCVNSPPTARGSQETRFTQPRAHLLADPCSLYSDNDNEQSAQRSRPMSLGNVGAPDRHARGNTNFNVRHLERGLLMEHRNICKGHK